MMIETSTIRCPDQSVISYDDFVKQIVDEAFSDAEIAIGSDSQVLDTHVSFVTCICIHYPGRGGKFFFIKERESRKNFPNMRMRLMNELFRSIEVANDLKKIISKNISIHADIGFEEKRSQTAKLSKEFIGIANSMGYNCSIKPDSWASYIADRFTKS